MYTYLIHTITENKKDAFTYMYITFLGCLITTRYLLAWTESEVSYGITFLLLSIGKLGFQKKCILWRCYFNGEIRTTYVYTTKKEKLRTLIQLSHFQYSFALNDMFVKNISKLKIEMIDQYLERTRSMKFHWKNSLSFHFS